ncbi:hypothetical protein BH10ACI1_BH10ACI1_32120 [soil metagenome]
MQTPSSNEFFEQNHFLLHRRVARKPETSCRSCSAAFYGVKQLAVIVKQLASIVKQLASIMKQLAGVVVRVFSSWCGVQVSWCDIL